MRLLTIFVLILTCSSCYAGFPWADDFETDDVNWTGNRPLQEMLTTEYNITAEANSSQSVKLSSTNFNADILVRNAASTSNEVTTAIVSFWFYDDGSTHKAFRLGVEDIATTQSSHLYIAAADIQATGNANTYTVLSNDNPAISSVPRSKGWHFTEITTEMDGAKLYLDGTELTPSFISSLKSPDSVVFAADSIATANTTASVYVDDVLYRSASSPGGTGQVNPPLDSQLAGPWSDDLEGTASQAWHNGIFPPGPFQSDAYNHTSDPGSSFSMMLNYNSPVTQLERICELPYEVQTTGTLSFWFYDNMQVPNAIFVGAEVINFTAGEGKIRAASLGIGVADGPNQPSLKYVVAKDTDTTNTGISRSAGWHYVEIAATHLGTTVRLDNQDVPGNLFPDYTKISKASFIAPYIEGGSSTVWVDDISYERIEPSSSVNDWTLY